MVQLNGSQLVSATRSAAADVLVSAAVFKQKASDSRVGLALPLNANLAAASKAKGTRFHWFFPLGLWL
jgi:hypothetical protein